MKNPCTYILASKPNGILYTGVTADIAKRLYQHIHGEDPKSFTSRYKVYNLVWLEVGESMEGAIHREKSIKCLSRARKVKLIEKLNPGWENLAVKMNLPRWEHLHV